LRKPLRTKLKNLRASLIRRASGQEKEKLADFAIHKDIDIQEQLEKALDVVMGRSRAQVAGN
jgi:hypothetical protein